MQLVKSLFKLKLKIYKTKQDKCLIMIINIELTQQLKINFQNIILN